AALAAGDGIVRASLTDRRTPALSNRWVQAEAELRDRRDTGLGAEIATRESEPPAYEDDLIKGLDRIAESIERVAAQLDSYHHERAEHLDAIEFLLREVVIGTVPPSATRPIVLGGVIDRETTARDDDEISLVLDSVAPEVDAA